jgi:hypothetical protein
LDRPRAPARTGVGNVRDCQIGHARAGRHPARVRNGERGDARPRRRPSPGGIHSQRG